MILFENFYTFIKKGQTFPTENSEAQCSDLCGSAPAVQVMHCRKLRPLSILPRKSTPAPGESLHAIYLPRMPG